MHGDITNMLLAANVDFERKHSALKMYGFYSSQNSLKRKETDCGIHRLVIPKSYFGLCSVMINYVYGLVSRSASSQW